MKAPIFGLLALALAGAGGDDPVDPALVGTWRSEVRNPQGAWTLTFRIEASGAWRTTIQGPVALPEEGGTIQASKGTWKLTKSSGQTDGGSYVLAGDSWTVTGQAGAVTRFRSVWALSSPSLGSAHRQPTAIRSGLSAG